MKSDIIERYIYASTKRLPSKIKDDVAEEIRCLIDDMLTERCGDATPTEKDIKIVLTELGTPNELYEKYNPDSDKCLIGSPYYSTYKAVLKFVLPCVGLGVLVSVLIDALTDSFANSATDVTSQVIDFFILFFKDLFISVPGVLLFAFSFITILFAIFYRKGVNIDTTEKLEDLPPVPKKKQQISKGDSIFGIVLSVVFLCVFLIVPQVFCVILSETSEIIPIFNVEVVQSLWYFTVLFSVVGIIREIVKLIEGRYNKKVMVTTIVSNVISAVVTVLWLIHDNIINSAFISRIPTIFEGEENFIVAIFSNFQIFLMVVILFALTLDTVVTTVKSLKK